MDPDPLVDALASDLASRIGRARQELRARMHGLGLTASGGWRIREEIRSNVSGTLFVMRPVHRRLDDPGIETAIQIGHDGRFI